MSTQLGPPCGFVAIHPHAADSEIGTCSNGVFSWAPSWDESGWGDEEQQAALIAWMRENPEATLGEPWHGAKTCGWLLSTYIDAGKVKQGPDLGDLNQALHRYGWRR